MRYPYAPLLAMLALAGPAGAQGLLGLPLTGDGSSGATRAPVASAPAPSDTGPNATVPTDVSSPIPRPAKVGTGAAPPGNATQGPQAFDYSVNLNSDVFGAQLFTGSFPGRGAARFNPDYQIAIGDSLQLHLWGAFEFESLFTVDAQGNIFLPRVGPVHVLGVRNKELQTTVEAAVHRVFRTNVFTYANLAGAQPVRVFVGGFVNRPGLYNGTSMDSLLQFLDQAGGINPDLGSFLTVQVKRGPLVRATLNLYDFLLDGRIPLVQLADGDVIFVPSRLSTVKATGVVANARRFEFPGKNISMSDLMSLTKPLAQATHARVTRNTGTTINIEYYPVEGADKVMLADGDTVEFTSDRKPGTITVRVEGEHLSAQEYVLAYGARLGEVMKQIKYSDRSDIDSIQLFRPSVRERQRVMLQAALKSLQSAALTARSGTSDEAQLRKTESDLLLQWVDRAQKIEPPGQVFIATAAERDKLLLESGDVIRIPSRDGLVLVNGEVLFPNAIAFEPKIGIDDYIRRAGGYTQNANTSRIVIAHRDGSFDDLSGESSSFFGGETPPAIRPGDEILVLPKIDVKSRQITKDWTQILFQIAVTTKVILGL